MAKAAPPFLHHIYDAINLIIEYIGDATFEEFESDRKTRDAVIRQLEIIGEAASNLESEVKEEHAEIPWREITDFRNVLAHEYWDIDIEIVWKAATEEVQELKTALTPLVEKVD